MKYKHQAERGAGLYCVCLARLLNKPCCHQSLHSIFVQDTKHSFGGCNIYFDPLPEMLLPISKPNHQRARPLLFIGSLPMVSNIPAVI